jgi:hypothetical protein
MLSALSIDYFYDDFGLSISRDKPRDDSMPNIMRLMQAAAVFGFAVFASAASYAAGLPCSTAVVKGTYSYSFTGDSAWHGKGQPIPVSGKGQIYFDGLGRSITNGVTMLAGKTIADQQRRGTYSVSPDKSGASCTIKRIVSWAAEHDGRVHGYTGLVTNGGNSIQTAHVTAGWRINEVDTRIAP